MHLWNLFSLIAALILCQNNLKAVNDISSMQAGDIFIYGGFPGHAVTVMAVAKNGEGKKIFLLSQGYMPAQDIHILKNLC